MIITQAVDSAKVDRLRSEDGMRSDLGGGAESADENMVLNTTGLAAPVSSPAPCAPVPNAPPHISPPTNDPSLTTSPDGWTDVGLTAAADEDNLGVVSLPTSPLVTPPPPAPVAVDY